MVFFRTFLGGQQKSLKAQLSMATISWRGKVDWEQNGRQENVFFQHNDQPTWKNEAVTPLDLSWPPFLQGKEWITPCFRIRVRIFVVYIMLMYILEVQPPFLICWFPNQHCCFCRSLSPSNRNHPVLISNVNFGCVYDKEILLTSKAASLLPLSHVPGGAGGPHAFERTKIQISKYQS